MIIDTTEEGCRRILANHLDDQVGTTRVLINKTGNIMNKTRNDDQRTFLKIVPELIARSAAS